MRAGILRVPHHLGRGWTQRPTEALRPPLARLVLTAAQRGGGFEAGHPFGGMVPVPLRQLLLPLPHPGLELGHLQLLLRDHGLQLIDQHALANH